MVNASETGHVPCDQGTAVCFDALTGDGKSEPQAHVVVATALGEVGEQHLVAARWQTAAVIRERISAGRPRNPKAFRMVIRLFGLERSGELVEEARNAFHELLGGGSPLGALLDLQLASRNQLIPVVG